MVFDGHDFGLSRPWPQEILNQNFSHGHVCEMALQNYLMWIPYYHTKSHDSLAYLGIGTTTLDLTYGFENKFGILLG